MHSMYVVAVGDVVVSVEGIHVVGRIWCRVTVVWLPQRAELAKVT